MIEQLRAALHDRYTIEREIGAGGMARVFLAIDLKHHRQVALKVLRPEVSGAVGSERFLREIQIAATLLHPHVLPLHDSGEANGLPYYVMPYVVGESLRHRRTSAARPKRSSPKSSPLPRPPSAPSAPGFRRKWSRSSRARLRRSRATDSPPRTSSRACSRLKRSPRGAAWRGAPRGAPHRGE